MDKIKETLLELYNNKDISLGIHGTSILQDKEQKHANKILREGLMCRYGDIRRTVSFQDRGYIHAHGNIEFDYLTSYKYRKDIIGYQSKEYMEDGRNISTIETVDLEQCSFIFGIPKELKTTDREMLLGPKMSFDMEFAESKDSLRLGKNKGLSGRAINPKYIIGYYMNGDISTFKHNSQFYGFKAGKFEIDFEKIQVENEIVRQKNEEKIQKTTQELGKETIEEQKETSLKDKMLKVFDKLISFVRGNSDKRRDD